MDRRAVREQSIVCIENTAAAQIRQGGLAVRPLLKLRPLDEVTIFSDDRALWAVRQP